MKNFRLLMVLFVLTGLTFVACDKDDDDPTFEEQIAGEWYAVKIEYANCDNPMYNEVITLPSTCDTDNCLRFTFEDDGVLSAYYNEDGDIEESEGSYEGDENSFTICIDGECVTGSMEVDDDEATFMYEEDDCDVTIEFKR